MLQSSSRQGGCLPGPGGCCLPGPGGGFLPGPGGGSPWQGGFCPEPPPVNRITHTCKNITLATTSLRPVTIKQKQNETFRVATNKPIRKGGQMLVYLLITAHENSSIGKANTWMSPHSSCMSIITFLYYYREMGIINNIWEIYYDNCEASDFWTTCHEVISSSLMVTQSYNLFCEEIFWHLYCFY